MERIIKTSGKILLVLALTSLIAWPAAAEVTFTLLDAPGQPDHAALSLSRNGKDMGCILDGAVYWWTAERGFRFLDAGSPLITQVGMAGTGHAMVAARSVGNTVSTTIWNHDGSPVILDTPDNNCPGSSAYCQGCDLSDDGSVVVGAARFCNSDHGFFWNNKTGLTTLNGLREYESFGLAVSADGAKMVGYSKILPLDNPCPTLWTSEATPMFPLGSDASGQAINISLNGLFVVGTVNQQAPAARGFIWSETEGCRILGTLNGKIADPSRAAAVSDQGVVVGWSGDELFGDQTAFIWDEVSGIRALDKVLAESGERLPKGLILQAALDISGDGKTIVGMGRNINYQRIIWMVQMDNPDALGSNLLSAETQIKPLKNKVQGSRKTNQADMMMSFPFGKNDRQKIPRQK